MKLEPRTLPDFVRIDHAGKSALVHPDFAQELQSALIDERGLQPTPYYGRGYIRSFPTSHGDVLVRQYRRGGIFRNVLKDRYLFHNRPRQELEVHCEAYRRGVATVLPVAAVWQQQGPSFRGAIATLRAGAVDLWHKIVDHGSATDEELAACGRAIRSMHAAGVLHADLNMKNLLVRGNEAWVIDFDRGRIVHEVGYIHSRDNFMRLKRSVVKHGNLLQFDKITEAYTAAGGPTIRC